MPPEFPLEILRLLKKAIERGSYVYMYTAALTPIMFKFLHERVRARATTTKLGLHSSIVIY